MNAALEPALGFLTAPVPFKWSLETCPASLSCRRGGEFLGYRFHKKSLSAMAEVLMSIDKSLKRKSAIVRQRSVLNREERIKQLQSEERW